MCFSCTYAVRKTLGNVCSLRYFYRNAFFKITYLVGCCIDEAIKQHLKNAVIFDLAQLKKILDVFFIHLRNGITDNHFYHTIFNFHLLPTTNTLVSTYVVPKYI